MNKRAIIYVLGAVLLIGAALMLLPLLVALIYHEVSGWYFLWVMLGRQCSARWPCGWAAASGPSCTRKKG